VLLMRASDLQPAGRGGHGHGRHHAFSAAVASSCVIGPSGIASRTGTVSRG